MRNASFTKQSGEDIFYTEVLRHPVGAGATMREWVKQRAYYERFEPQFYDEAEQVLWIDSAIFGYENIDIFSVNLALFRHINKTHQSEDADQSESAGEDGDQAGPSTSKQGS